MKVVDGMVWNGMEWYGMVWNGMEWYMVYGIWYMVYIWNGICMNTGQYSILALETFFNLVLQVSILPYKTTFH